MKWPQKPEPEKMPQKSLTGSIEQLNSLIREFVAQGNLKKETGSQ
jgi:hypothetical protein